MDKNVELGERIRSLPCWSGPVEWQPLEGGLSNESFSVKSGGEMFVVRFGRDFPFHHVFRDREIMVCRAAQDAGFTPELVYAEPGVMVSRFIDGVTYDADGVKANLNRVAELIAAFHRQMPAHVSGPAFMFWVFHVIRDYARTLENGGSRMSERLPDYLDLAAELEAAQIPMPIVFGHHDLLPANFIDDGSKLWIIDFEYAGFSTPMFDLAGATSNSECNAEQSAAFLTAYLGHHPDEAMLKSHAAMQCASLLREAMWSMVSELHLDVPGVDYVAYTNENLAMLEAALNAYRSEYGRD